MSTTVASTAASDLALRPVSALSRPVIIAGLLIHLLAAYFSVGYYAADEHFQILEFAGLRTGLNQVEDLPWEFPTRMRPALQPAMALVAIRALDAVGIDNPFAQATVLRLVSALLSLWFMLLLFRAFAGELKTERFRSWFLFLSMLLWFLPFQHARFSSETWSGLAFFGALALLVPTLRARDVRRTHPRLDLGVGLLLGLAFLFRYQAGLLVAPLGLWLLWRAHPGWRRLATLGFGILLALGIGLLLDRWFYGAWTLTAWNYLKINLIDGKAAGFGTNPWWAYFGFVARHGIFPIGPLIIAAFLLVWIYRPGHVITWTTLTFVAVHMLIDHKELRFLFTLANIVPFVMVYAAQNIADDARWRRVTAWAARGRPVLLAIFVVVNTAALLFASLKPAEPLVYFFRNIYENYEPDSTAVVFTEENPYGRVQIPATLFPELPEHLTHQIDDKGKVPLLINFYRHREIPLVHLRDAADVARYADSTDRKVLLAWRRLQLDPDMRSLDPTPVYCFLPAWVTDLDVADWTSRTQIWTLYEVKEPPPPAP